MPKNSRSHRKSRLQDKAKETLKAKKAKETLKAKKAKAALKAKNSVPCFFRSGCLKI